jgi:putative mycofactocin binding protein MftB
VTEAFNLDSRWTLAPRVAVRHEPFGALAYHFGTRRLSFLKTRKLVAVVEALAQEPSARRACAVAGVSAEELPAYELALAGLAAKGMISPGEQHE